VEKWDIKKQVIGLTGQVVMLSADVKSLQEKIVIWH
jgi:hypothetical protein